MYDVYVYGYLRVRPHEDVKSSWESCARVEAKEEEGDKSERSAIFLPPTHSL